jgi:hypothetical protein
MLVVDKLREWRKLQATTRCSIMLSTFRNLKHLLASLDYADQCQTFGNRFHQFNDINASERVAVNAKLRGELQWTSSDDDDEILRIPPRRLRTLKHLRTRTTATIQEEIILVVIVVVTLLLVLVVVVVATRYIAAAAAEAAFLEIQVVPHRYWLDALVVVVVVVVLAVSNMALHRQVTNPSSSPIEQKPHWSSTCLSL